MAALHYFAFGSNLNGARLRERAPSARALGAARLAGFRLCLDKLASDGSGKLNLARDAAASVWGVAFRIDPAELAALDGFEPGYTQISVSVRLRDVVPLEARTYLSEQRAPGLRPQPWYRELILAGAREHGLPAEWIERLERL
ncbi:MAG TPA: gamma-glutamylcyclotransferase [Myxococcota bacterium]